MMVSDLLHGGCPIIHLRVLIFSFPTPILASLISHELLALAGRIKVLGGSETVLPVQMVLPVCAVAVDLFIFVNNGLVSRDIV